MSNDLQIYKPSVPAPPKPKRAPALVPKPKMLPKNNLVVRKPHIKKNTRRSGVPPWDPVVFRTDPSEYKDFDGGYWFTSNGIFYNYDVDHFVLQQLKRFRIPAPKQDFRIYCWDIVISYIAFISEDSLFYGQSDVMRAYDHHYYQYAIKNDLGQLCEVRSDAVKIFRFKHNFNDIYDHHYHNPNLRNNMKSLEHHIYETCESGRYDNDDQIEKFKRQYGHDLYTFMHFVSWAIIMWVVQKQNQDWRSQKCFVYSMCYEHGECLNYMGGLYPPTEYQKINRPAHSCARCGIRTSCVKIYNVNKSGKKYSGYHSIFPYKNLYLNGITPGAYMFCERCAVENLRKHDKCKNYSCTIHKCSYNHYHQESPLIP